MEEIKELAKVITKKVANSNNPKIVVPIAGMAIAGATFYFSIKEICKAGFNYQNKVIIGSTKHNKLIDNC